MGFRLYLVAALIGLASASITPLFAASSPVCEALLSEGGVLEDANLSAWREVEYGNMISSVGLRHVEKYLDSILAPGEKSLAVQLLLTEMLNKANLVQAGVYDNFTAIARQGLALNRPNRDYLAYLTQKAALRGLRGVDYGAYVASRGVRYFEDYIQHTEPAESALRIVSLMSEILEKGDLPQAGVLKTFMNIANTGIALNTGEKQLIIALMHQGAHRAFPVLPGFLRADYYLAHRTPEGRRAAAKELLDVLQAQDLPTETFPRRLRGTVDYLRSVVDEPVI